MKKKGFTLIELLGVIIVLAIIALIAVPTILGVIDKAKKGALKDSAYGLIEAANLYYAQYGVSNTERFNLEEENELKYKGKVESGTVLLNSKGKVMICINDNGNAAYKNYNDNEVIVISGKTCNVNTSEKQILLDGEKTIDEYTNQELTDLVNNLQEQIEIQNEKIKNLQQQVNNKTDNSSIATLTTKHNEDINSILNNKADKTDLTSMSNDITTLSNNLGTFKYLKLNGNNEKDIQTALRELFNDKAAGWYFYQGYTEYQLHWGNVYINSKGEIFGSDFGMWQWDGTPYTTYNKVFGTSISELVVVAKDI